MEQGFKPILEMILITGFVTEKRKTVSSPGNSLYYFFDLYSELNYCHLQKLSSSLS